MTHSIFTVMFLVLISHMEQPKEISESLQNDIPVLSGIDCIIAKVNAKLSPWFFSNLLECHGKSQLSMMFRTFVCASRNPGRFRKENLPPFEQTREKQRASYSELSATNESLIYRNTPRAVHVPNSNSLSLSWVASHRGVEGNLTISTLTSNLGFIMWFSKYPPWKSRNASFIRFANACFA